MLPAPVRLTDIPALRRGRDRTEWGLLVGLWLLLGLLLAYNGWQERQLTAQRESDRMANMARLLGDQLDRELHAVNHALLWVRNGVSQGMGPEDLAQAVTFVEVLPMVRGLSVLDAGGRVRLSTLPELRGLRLEAAPYFATVRARPDASQLYVSVPYPNALGEWSISVSRAMTGPRGEFAGVVTALLDTTYLRELFLASRYLPDVWTALAHGQGLQLLMVPEREGQAGLNLAQPGSFFSRHLESGRAYSTLTGQALATGEFRTMAVRTIAPLQIPMDFPLLLAIGRDHSALFAPWQHDMWLDALVWLLLCVFSAAGLWTLQLRQAYLLRVAEAAQHRVREATEDLDRFFRTGLNLMAISDQQGRLVHVNPAWSRMLGYSAEQLSGLHLADLAHPDDREATEAALHSLAAGKPLKGFVNRCRTHTGGHRSIEWHVAPFDGRLYVDARDVTEQLHARQALESLNTQLEQQGQKLRAIAFVDGLTGVANRRRFDEALQQEWRQCQRDGRPLALVMVDIDHFKLYNDFFGHQTGDTCLQAVARALQGAVGRPHDVLARYGGEEFVALLPGTPWAGALAKAEEMRQAVAALNLPHPRSPVVDHVTVSLGVAVAIPADTLNSSDLLAQADAALYDAKHHGRNRVMGGEGGKGSEATAPAEPELAPGPEPISPPGPGSAP